MGLPWEDVPAQNSSGLENQESSETTANVETTTSTSQKLNAAEEASLRRYKPRIPMKTENPIDFRKLDIHNYNKQAYLSWKHRDETERQTDQGEHFDELEEYYEEHMKIEFAGNSEFNLNPVDMNSIADTRLAHNLKKVMHYKKLNALQTRTLPIIESGHNLLVMAPTGIGKTSAFMIPAINRVIGLKRSGSVSSTPKPDPFVLVLSNTRQLTLQTYQRSMMMIGTAPGNSDSISLDEVNLSCITSEIRGANDVSDIAVATMGTLKEKIKNGDIEFKNLKLLIVDEADKMTDNDAFGRDLKEFYDGLSAQVKDELQVALFSATFDQYHGELMANEVIQMLVGDDFVYLTVPAVPGAITQHVIEIKTDYREQEKDVEKSELILKLNHIQALIQEDLKRTKCDKNGPYEETIGIFCETVKRANQVAVFLQMLGYNFLPLSRVISKKQQDMTMQKLKKKEIHGVVCTNIFSRGIDIQSIRHIIVMELGLNFDSYRHRIGRTGRAGHEGKATVLMSIQQYEHNNRNMVQLLVEFLRANNQIVPKFLETAYNEIVRGLRAVQNFGSDEPPSW